MVLAASQIGFELCLVFLAAVFPAGDFAFFIVWNFLFSLKLLTQAVAHDPFNTTYQTDWNTGFSSRRAILPSGILVFD